MASDQVVIRAGSSSSAPLDYVLPAAVLIQPLTVRAVFDGASAGSGFLPTLQIISDAGLLVAQVPVSSQVASGGSADVTFAPFLRPSGTSGPSSVGWSLTTEPLISPSQAWEGGVVQEPDIHYESGTWRMWYTGNYLSPAMGYASCTSDPTVPGNWTKYASNPVLGQGGSGVAGWVSGLRLTKVGSTFHCFYYDAVGGGALKRSTSTDGLSWGAPTTAIAKGAVGSTPGGWANSEIWYDGSLYWLFVEGSTVGGGGPPWACWLFTNASITNDGGWSAKNGGNPLSTLQVSGYPRGYGQGPNLAEIDGTRTFAIGGRDTLWYHIDRQIGGTDTTDMTHAYTSDVNLVTWAPSNVLDLAHSGSTYEKDQVADPCVLQVAGTSYLFFTGIDNATPAGYISVATFPGTLVELLARIG